MTASSCLNKFISFLKVFKKGIHQIIEGCYTSVMTEQLIKYRLQTFKTDYATMSDFQDICHVTIIPLQVIANVVCITNRAIPIVKALGNKFFGTIVDNRNAMIFVNLKLLIRLKSWMIYRSKFKKK